MGTSYLKQEQAQRGYEATPVPETYTAVLCPSCPYSNSTPATVPCEHVAKPVNKLLAVDSRRILTQRARVLHVAKRRLGRC